MKQTKITYVGSMSGVHIGVPGGCYAKRGEAVELDSELARKLVAQDPKSWKTGSGKKGGDN
jgi:hypothetical protein